LRDDMVSTCGAALPSGLACLQDDFEACIVHLCFPLAHRRAIRTTNMLERLFGEKRRRTKVVPLPSANASYSNPFFMGSNMAQDSKVATELRKKANKADGIADSYEGQRQEKWFRGFAEVMRTGAREIELLELEKELLKKALADAVAARSA
jgi:transposase-like protein